jgi:hypothetical protein
MVPWPPRPVPLAGQATKACRKHLQIQAMRHPEETLLSVETPVSHPRRTCPRPSTIPWQEERGEWSRVSGPMERTGCGMVPALAPWPTGSYPQGFGCPISSRPLLASSGRDSPPALGRERRLPPGSPWKACELLPHPVWVWALLVVGGALHGQPQALEAKEKTDR